MAPPPEDLAVCGDPGGQAGSIKPRAHTGRCNEGTAHDTVHKNKTLRRSTYSQPIALAAGNNHRDAQVDAQHTSCLLCSPFLTMAAHRECV